MQILLQSQRKKLRRCRDRCRNTWQKVCRCRLICRNHGERQLISDPVQELCNNLTLEPDHLGICSYRLLSGDMATAKLQ